MQDALRYLQAVLPAHGLRVVASKPPRWNKGFKHDFLPTNDDVISLARRLDDAGTTNYIALATYRDPEAGRVAENTEQLQCLWLDVDFKHYQSEDEGRADVQRLVEQIGPASVQVHSGGGLHTYWVLRAPLPTAQWKILASAFQAKWQSIGVHADPVSADAARVLRLPGTHNRKEEYGEPRLVTLEFAEDITYDAEALMKKLGVAPAPVPVAVDMNDDLGAGLEQRPSYIQPMLQRCRQLQYAFANQDKASEPYWYATIQLVRHVEDGRRLAHAFSCKHPGYSQSVTEDKLAQLEAKGIGPTTCERFKMLNPGGCQGCEFSITSPIQLGYKEVEEVVPEVVHIEHTTTEDGQAVEVERRERPNVDMPPGFKFDGQFIYRQIIDEDTKLKRDEPVIQGFLCPERLVVNERNNYSTDIQLYVHPAGQLPKRVMIPAKVLSEKRDIARELHSRGIFFMSKNANHILELLQRMTQALQQQRRDTPIADQMGWQDDGSFVIGSTLYARNTPPLFDIPVPASTKPVVRAYEPAGSMEKWKETAEIYNRPGGEPYQFALCYGAAGVFLPLAKLSGVVLSLYSQNAGRGKSTVGYGALSWWGNPDGLKSQSKDTNNALFHKASRHKNLPILMDEVTDKPTWELEELVYFMTQGREKESLTSDRTARPVLPAWALPAISTSNNSLRTKVQSRRGDSQGLFARIIEVPFDLPFAETLGFSDRMTLRNGFVENYGHAGPAIIKYALDNPDLCRSMMDKFMLVFDNAIEGDSAYRFWVAACAATMTVCTVANHLGLLHYDVGRLTSWATETLKSQRTDAVNSVASSDDVLAQFLEQNANRIVISYVRQLGGAATAPAVWPEDGVRGSELVGRAEISDRSLFVSLPAFLRFCTDRGFDIGAFIRTAANSKDAAGEPLLKHPSPVFVNLGKGTKTASARIKTLEFNLLHSSLREFASGVDSRVGEPTNIRSVK